MPASETTVEQDARRYRAIVTRGLYLYPPDAGDPEDRQWEVRDPFTGDGWYGATLDEAMDKAIRAEIPDAD